MGESSKRSFMMMSLEGAEALFDFLTQNEAIKAVPVLSTAVRFLEGVHDVRSRLFAAKLAAFISEPSLIRSLSALRLRTEILDDAERANFVGETLLMVIDKMTDLEKPRMLAKIYAHLLEGGMDGDEFLLLAHAIDIGGIRDLQALIRNRQPHTEARALWHARLAPGGLLVGDITPLAGSTPITYHISPLGDIFLRAIDRADAVPS